MNREVDGSGKGWIKDGFGYHDWNEDFFIMGKKPLKNAIEWYGQIYSRIEEKHKLNSERRVRELLDDLEKN